MDKTIEWRAIRPTTRTRCATATTAALPSLGEPAIDQPFRHEFKFGASVPLWWGIETSAALQSYAGAQKGVTWSITPNTTRYPSDCSVPGCTPGGLVVAGAALRWRPGRGEHPARHARHAVPAEELAARLRDSKGVRPAGSRRIAAEFNVYNLLNDNAVLTELQALGSNASVAPFVDGGPGGRPTGIMYPRIMRLGASVEILRAGAGGAGTAGRASRLLLGLACLACPARLPCLPCPLPLTPCHSVGHASRP